MKNIQILSKLSISEIGKENMNKIRLYLLLLLSLLLFVACITNDNPNDFDNPGNSNNSGISWPLTFSILKKINNLNGPIFDMTIDGNGDIYVFCYNQETPLVFTRSSDKGENWSNPKRIHNLKGWPAVISDDFNNLYLICTEENNVYFSQSGDRGNSWSTPKSIRIKNDDLWSPNISISNGASIVATWIEGNPSPNNWEKIYITNSVDNGNTWGTAKKIADGRLPSIGCDPNGNFSLAI